MYIPKKYQLDSWDVREELIRTYPLGTVITTDEDGSIIANHIPFYLHIDKETGKKYLRAHISKKNHQIPSLTHNDRVLVIFQSHDSYISPSYYPEKERTHKFVPTWDFGALHIYGTLKIVHDYDFVRAQLNALTDQQEKPKSCPWKVSDAPAKYLDLMQKPITGLEIEIDQSLCKFKFEQDMSVENCTGVIEGLAQDGKTQVSDLVKKCNS